MQKRLMVVLVLLIAFGAVAMISGCKPSSPTGKVQIMFSGNIRGNVSPCG